MAKKTFVCPYCFEKNKISDIQFRCVNKRCSDVPDIEYTIYVNGDINMPVNMKNTFSFKGHSLPASAICPDCGKTTFKRICPSCHNELPEATISGKDLIISLVGSRGTGKSLFVGVIIEELIKRISVSFGGSCEGFGDSYRRWKSGFREPLYTNNEILGQTRSSFVDTDNGAYKPLIFKFKIQRKSLLKKEIDSFTLVFFDTAGEDLNDEDTMSTVNKYICQSAGIIFLLDPMQIPDVVAQLDEATVSSASGSGGIGQGAEADDIMTRVSNLIRNNMNMTETEKIDIPVAAVFSKFDAVTSLIPDGSVILETSPHCKKGFFDLKDFNNVNGEIVSLLSEWNEEAFTSQLQTNYSQYAYFGVSTLGLNNNPVGNKIQVPRPHRIEDPLLWIFSKYDVIKKK